MRLWGRTLVPLGFVAVALAAVPASAGAAPHVHWLCKPGLAHDPCSVSLKTTRFSPSLKRLGVDDIRPARHPKFDCFYVYPTVSDQKTPLANLHVDPELRSIALFQAARYASECRVFAPVYRQVTLGHKDTVTPAERAQGYSDVRAAWRLYLRKFNDGRGVVLIGHSQGTNRLTELVTKEIDPRPAVRKRLISALLLGGNVLVKRDRDVGGDFKHVKACRSRRQVGCVVAFSTFNAPVPADANHGRTSEPGLEVLCTNPAALGGGTGKLTPVYPTDPFAPGTTMGLAFGVVGWPAPPAPTPWISLPGSYSARCSSAAGADVLQVTGVGAAPKLNAVPAAAWGLHLTDATIALGNLVDLVRAQAVAWRERKERR
jgi:hypothetical protein